MTTLQKLSILLIASILISIVLFFYKLHVVLIILCLLNVLLCVIWYRILREELILYRILENDRMMRLENIINIFGRSAEAVIKRLEEKGMVTISDRNVLLRIENYKFSFRK